MFCCSHHPRKLLTYHSFYTPFCNLVPYHSSLIIFSYSYPLPFFHFIYRLRSYIKITFLTVTSSHFYILFIASYQHSYEHSFFLLCLLFTLPHYIHIFLSCILLPFIYSFTFYLQVHAIIHPYSLLFHTLNHFHVHISAHYHLWIAVTFPITLFSTFSNNSYSFFCHIYSSLTAS